MADQILRRKTRIVCVSDTHNASPHSGAFKLPAGDILIHAGDLTNQGTLSELQRTITWLAAAPYEAKIVVAGNHDITLDAPFYAAHRARFHNQAPQDPAACRNLLAAAAPTITYLEHAATTVRLTAPSGPRTSLTVFGSPYSPANGNWAFGYDSSAEDLWATIPPTVDVVVAHTPPLGLCDTDARAVRAGCGALRQALGRVRPKLVVCGHIHSGRGAAVVRWGADGEVLGLEPWADPGLGNKRQSLLSLVGREGISSGGETCVVNAAVAAQDYPHKGRWNKPIVVDVELPVVEEEAEAGDGGR